MQLKLARPTSLPSSTVSTLSRKRLACNAAAPCHTPPLRGQDGRLQQAVRPMGDVFLPRARGVQGACARERGALLARAVFVLNLFVRWGLTHSLNVKQVSNKFRDEGPPCSYLVLRGSRASPRRAAFGGARRCRRCTPASCAHVRARGTRGRRQVNVPTLFPGWDPAWPKSLQEAIPTAKSLQERSHCKRLYPPQKA